MTRYALVVGIAQYDRFHNLNKAATDAEAIAQLLEQHSYTVTRLPRKLVAENENQWVIDPGKKLTAEKLSTELKIFLNERAIRQNTVIYFAGHGFRASDALTDEQIGYLATSDSIQNGQNAIPMNSLNTLINKSNLGSLVMLLDCCYAGTLIEQRSLLQPTQSIIGQKQNYCLIAACRDFERAREGKQHGIFTEALLQGLSSENAVDGEVTSNDLFSFVSRRLQRSGQEVIHAQKGQPIPLVTLQQEDVRHLQEKSGVSSASKSNQRSFLHKQDIDTFTGRTKELKQLEAQLLNISGDKTGNIVSISGNGGWGKSTLASRFASLHEDKFDRVIMLPVSGKAVHEVARDFARLAGKEVEEDEDLSPAILMQEVFAHRRMLLIFDDVDNADLKVLQPGGLCSLIITTRKRSIPGSFNIPKAGMINLSSFPKNDARELLREIVGKRVDDEPEAANRILKLTGNLPLALEIVGRALQQWSELSLSKYADYLKEEEDRLEELKHDDDIRLNVKASLEMSLKFLEDADIELFACLSACAEDGFSLETAMQAGGLLSRRESRKRIEKLYWFSLLNEVKEERYVFHTLVRIFAQAQAQKRNLWDAATKRHAEYFLNFVQSNDVESPEIANRIAEDFEDILQAAQWLRKHATSDHLKESAYQFALDLRPFLLKYSYSEQAIELMTGFQAWAEDLKDWYASVRFRIQHAKYLALEGKLSEAEVILRNTQDSIEQIRDPIQRQESQLKQLNSLGGVLRKQGKFEQAIATFQREITIAEAFNNKEQVVIGLHGLGMVFQAQGNLEGAIHTFERSIVIVESLNDHISLAIVLNRLGGLLQQQNKFEEAIYTFERSIAIAETFDEKEQVVIGLDCLAGVLQKQGNLDAAITAFERQIPITEVLDDQRRLAISLNRLGGLLQQQGKFEEAISVFKREIDIDRNLSDKRQLLIGLNCLGRALQQQENFEEAITTFKEQIEIVKTLNDQKQEATGWGCLGAVYRQQENFDEAIVACRNEIRIEKDLKNQQQLVFAWNRLGEVFKESDNLEDAVDAYNQSIKIAKELDDKINWAIGLDCRGSALRKQGKLREATSAFKEEIAIAETLANLRQLAIGWNSLAEISRLQGDLEESIFAFLQAATYNELLKDKPQLHSIRNRLGDILSNEENWKAANVALQRLYSLTQDLKDSLHVAMTLHVLGQAYNTINQLEEAENVLQKSREKLYDLNDSKQLLEVFKTLSETFENRQDWKQAEQVIRESYNEAEKLKDISIKEKILRRLVKICSKQNSEEKLMDAQTCFRGSLELSREMNDPIRLAKAYKTWGEALRNLGKPEDAVSVLIEGFEEIINDIEIHGQKSGRYIGSLRTVTKTLGHVLVQLGRREEALEYCDRASLTTDYHDTWINLRNKFLNTPNVIPKRRK